MILSWFVFLHNMLRQADTHTHTNTQSEERARFNAQSHLICAFLPQLSTNKHGAWNMVVQSDTQPTSFVSLICFLGTVTGGKKNKKATFRDRLFGDFLSNNQVVEVVKCQKKREKCRSQVGQDAIEKLLVLSEMQRNKRRGANIWNWKAWTCKYSVILFQSKKECLFHQLLKIGVSINWCISPDGVNLTQMWSCKKSSFALSNFMKDHMATSQEKN